MKVDFIIVGQGIAGTLLSRCLVENGSSVVVIDNKSLNSASRVAGGIINPVTGKRLVKTWMADELLPFAKEAYIAIEKELNIPLLQCCDIIDFHLTEESAGIFAHRQDENAPYLSVPSEVGEWHRFFRYNYGVGEIRHSMSVDIHALLAGWSDKMERMKAFIEESFDFKECIVTESLVRYKGISASKIIFCDGTNGAQNPYFKNLTWARDKGEALIVAIPGLPATHIYKQGISIVPWHSGLFWVGATHDWKFTDMMPSGSFRSSVAAQLNYWLKEPYEIVDHIVASRPANIDRKPFLGFHPAFPAVGIFNGLGGKGCSLAPYFADHMAQHIIHGTPLLPNVDINRCAKLLGR